MKAKFASAVKIENIFDGGLYMLGSQGRSFVGLALCRAKREYVVSLSPSPGNKTAPGLEPVERLYPVAAYLLDLDLELFLSPSDVLLDQEAPAQPGEITVIGDHHYLCFTDGEKGPRYVTFGTGQIQSELPDGPRNRYPSWQLFREVAGEREVLVRCPYRTAKLTLLPEPEERRQEAKPVSRERRRDHANLASSVSWSSLGYPATSPVPQAGTGD
jgi:hypothetical protein